MVEVRNQFKAKRAEENDFIERCESQNWADLDTALSGKVIKHFGLHEDATKTVDYVNAIGDEPKTLAFNTLTLAADMSSPDKVHDFFKSQVWCKARNWEPESNKCIDISTRSSLQEMILPGTYAICIPVFVGFLVGARCLMGMLAGSVGAGAMMAIMMSNAGGAWDNSKKYIEIAQAHGGKGTDIHKACVVGDTVGDPFKDTSGPALNILLKLMAMVSLTIATLLKGQDDWELWYYMFIPLAIMIIATILVLYFNYAQREDFEVDTEPEEPPAPAPKPQPVVETPMEPV